ncbi:hypothetical protein H1R20_g13011, partial [Candolleomyces eurysporus]
MPPTTNDAASTGRFHDARDTDIVIPIIGRGGAGKSTFINYLLQGASCSGKAVLVGHGLDPCTTQLEYVVIDSGCRSELKDIINRKIVLVDTPGLDGTDLSRAAQGTQYQEDFKKTEKTLKGYWQPMTNAGAQIQRLQAGSGKESAWQIIRSVLEKAEENIAISEHESAARASKPKVTTSKVWSLENARETDIVILQLDYIVFEEGLTDHWKRIRGRRIVIVDTPGFNNTEVEDTVLLHHITRWLVQSNKKMVGLGWMTMLTSARYDRLENGNEGESS